MSFVLVAVVSVIIRVWMRYFPLFVPVDELRQKTRLLPLADKPVFEQIFRRRTLHIIIIIIIITGGIISFHINNSSKHNQFLLY